MLPVDPTAVEICALKEKPWTLIESARQLGLVHHTQNGIPKILHQTWKTKDIPEIWSKGATAWKILHPDWLYVLWTDADLHEYILSRHPEFWNTWTHFTYHIQRVDAVRYFLLQDFGGLYSDLDLMPRENVEAYLSGVSDVFLVKSANEPCYTNMLMAARWPRVFSDNLWSRMIHRMKNTQENPHWYFVLSKHFHVMMTTGPLSLTYVADQYTESITVLSKVRFNHFGILDAGDLDYQASQRWPIMYVLPGSSWHSWDSIAINLLLKYKWWLVTVISMVLVFSTFLAMKAYSEHEGLRKLSIRHLYKKTYRPMIPISEGPH